MSKETLGILATFSANCIFGLSFMFSKIALQHANVFLLLSMRFFTAFLLLNLLLLFRLAKINFRGKKMIPLLITGILQPVLYFIGDNYCLFYTTTSLAGTVVAMIPIVAMILSAIFLKEIPSRRQVFCMILGFIGVAITSWSGSSAGIIQPIGLLLLAGTVLSSAGFNVMSKGISSVFSPFERTYLMFAMGFAVFTTLSLLQEKGQWLTQLHHAVTQVDFLLAVLYLAVLSSVVAFLLINYSLSHISVARSASFANVTTIVSILAGVFLLDEPLSPSLLIGMILVLLGVYGVNAKARVD